MKGRAARGETAESEMFKSEVESERTNKRRVARVRDSFRVEQPQRSGLVRLRRFYAYQGIGRCRNFGLPALMKPVVGVPFIRVLLVSCAECEPYSKLGMSISWRCVGGGS